MDRAVAYLVKLLVCTACPALSAGCAQDLPKTVMIDDAFTAEEESMIVEMIDEWNSVGREYLGLDRIIVYQGRCRDPNGFDPGDLEDGRSVVYRGSYDRYYRYLQNVDDDGLTLLGYGTNADVILFTFNFEDEQEFRHVALHELGHFLSLLHAPDSEAVMYYLTPDDPPTRLTWTDIKAFCLVYDCLKQP